ncbi:MAG: DUF3718 domain-containing protein [Gammaproteobacteria bacterium]|nr:DUF3718 domain-containing protein [Gammaproteobacteria bacterium]
MRPIISLCALAGVALVAMPVLASPRYKAADDSTESMLCVSAAADKHMRFRMNLAGTSYNLRSLPNLVTCNGAPIGEFAKNAGNDRNAGLLQRFYKVRGQVEIRDVQSSTEASPPAVADSAEPVILVGGRLLD